MLLGQGGYEWTNDLEEQYIPHDRNPARGYICTANQDNVGVTDDGDYCNDGHYLGGDFAPGYRDYRIDQRLSEMAAGGQLTTDDMIHLQAETKSSLGERLRDPILASLEHAIGDTSDDPALAAAMAEAGADGVSALTQVRDRFAAWTLATPHAIGSSDDAEIADSVATTIFNVTIVRLDGLAFNDEVHLIGRRPGDLQTARMLEWALSDAADQQALPPYCYRSDYQVSATQTVTGWNDCVYWDDIATNDVVETRDERAVRAVLATVAWLERVLGSDWDEWRWGRLHAARFSQIVPPAGGPELVSIPPSNSAGLPLGFPRHGDFGAVDVGNFSMWNTMSFTHGSGASQRLVVEMTPDGPRPFNALPGGQSEDVDSPHHADEAEHWRENEQPPVYFERADVGAHAEQHIVFTTQ